MLCVQLFERWKGRNNPLCPQTTGSSLCSVGCQHSADTSGSGTLNGLMVGNGHLDLRMRVSEKRRESPGSCWCREKLLCLLCHVYATVSVPDVASTGMTTFLGMSVCPIICLLCSTHLLTHPLIPSPSPLPPTTLIHNLTHSHPHPQRPLNCHPFCT